MTRSKSEYIVSKKWIYTNVLFSIFKNEDDKSKRLNAPEVSRYIWLLGDLRYLFGSTTRFNMVLSVSKLAKHLMLPISQHIQLLKHVLRFICGAKSHGLLFQHSHNAYLSS